jgi:hypothetical protein
MTKRKSANRKRRALQGDARERAITLYSLIADEMLGLVKAEDQEGKYARLRLAKRELTERQFKGRARIAAEYFVDHANPSPAQLTREESVRLTEEAINHALESPFDEET